MKVILAQFVDLDNGQRSEPFSIEKDKASEILNMLEDWLNGEVKEHRPNSGVMVICEDDGDGLKVSKAPIMKFETFKKVMEQKSNG